MAGSTTSDDIEDVSRCLPASPDEHRNYFIEPHVGEGRYLRGGHASRSWLASSTTRLWQHVYSVPKGINAADIKKLKDNHYHTIAVSTTHISPKP